MGVTRSRQQYSTAVQKDFSTVIGIAKYIVSGPHFFRGHFFKRRDFLFRLEGGGYFRLGLGVRSEVM